MIAVVFGLLAATSLEAVRFGPYQNVVVERIGDQPMISAYGDAHVVRLHVSKAQLADCAALVGRGGTVECAFPHSGSLDFRPLATGGYEFRFSDTLKANVVEFVVDDSGLERALDALRTPI
ncbi:hypothetical protein [Dokdonella sp.]|uniref:hypothetical protein n=1 Tax=Dokdonella sp. TaxID=2291710 RepID=UPI0026197E4D|nr:hypothetical protein [Dokdonella sp.]